VSAVRPDGHHPAALAPTPAQTIGPYFGFALPYAGGSLVVPEGTAGAIRVGGQLLDGEGVGVPDGLIETWQADPDGRFSHPDDPRGAARGDEFHGFARCPTDRDGGWSILSLKPGRVPGPGESMQAPHITVSVFARGMLQRLVTRIYFADEEESNAADPVLSTLRYRDDVRETLLAEPVQGGYRFDIRLQGEDETLFLAI
jgi:protocatechuate 3,4-dioxygenase, alpha subunit